MPYDAKKVAGQQLTNTRTFPSINLSEGMNVILFRDIDGKFATTTNGAIVKKSNGEVLPDDEPLWLFRARDVLALKYLQMYTAECQTLGLDWQVNKAEDILQAFKDFATEHPERMKQPGVTRGK